jgi:hypothetical protein
MKYIVGAALLALISASASAQIDGFGDGSGFTVNKSPNDPAQSGTFSNGVFTLTTASGDIATSVFANQRQAFTLGFTATFTYQATNGADGFVFTLHNDDINALGDSGGEKGYTDNGGKADSTSPISPSVAIASNIYQGNGIGQGVNGVQSGFVDPLFDLTAGPIDYTISYDPVTTPNALKVIVTNGTTTFQRDYAVGNIATVLGSTDAYVGFAGGTGGVSSNQTISNFKYTPVPEPGTGALVALSTVGIAMMRRRRR